METLQRSPDPLAGGEGNIPSQRTAPLSTLRALVFGLAGSRPGMEKLKVGNPIRVRGQFVGQ